MAKKKGSKRRMKKQVRKTFGALFLAAAIGVAMIPTRSIEGGEAQAANSCNGANINEYYILKQAPSTPNANTPTSEIPFVNPSTTVYTTGDMHFMFAYVNAAGVDATGDTNKFAIILGYDPSGAVDSSGNLVIPEYVQSYKKLSDAEGYCLANVSGEYLYYRFLDSYEFSIKVADGATNPIESNTTYYQKYSVGDQTYYDFLQPYVPEAKRENPGYFELVKPNRIGLFKVDDKSGKRDIDENGVDQGNTIYTYRVENTTYIPCTAANSSTWSAYDKSSLFYRNEAVSEDSELRYQQCTDAAKQYVDNIAVRYIGNQFVYYDNATRQYKISTDAIDDAHPGNGVFADTKGGNIVNLTIPTTMEGIGDYAFYRCTALNRIQFSNGLVAIGNHAFDGCGALTSVGMPESPRINTIGAYAFKNCSSLSSFYIPHSISMLCDGVFEYCTSLTSMDLSGDINEDPTTEQAQLIKIGNHLFYGCSNLETVILPAKLGQGYTSDDTGCRKININIFEDCPNLKKITVVSPNVKFVDDNHPGCGFCVGSTAQASLGSFHGQLVSDEFYFESKDPAAAQPPSTNIGALHRMCQSMDTGYEFTYKYYGQELYEKTVAEEGGGKAIYQVDNTNSMVGFLANGNVESLSFPEHFGPYHIEKIPDGKCMNICTLKKVTLPSTINEIGASAFKGCHNLTIVFFGNDQVVIGDEAFKTQHTSNHSPSCPDLLTDSTCPATIGSTPNVRLYFVTTVDADSTPFAYAMSDRGKYNHPQQTDSWPIVFSGFPNLLEISYNPAKRCAELIKFPTEGSLDDYVDPSNIYLSTEEKTAISHYLSERTSKSREELEISGTTYDKQLVAVCNELFIPKGVASIEDGLFKRVTTTGGDYPMKVNTSGLTEIDVDYTKDANGSPILDSNGRVQIDTAKSDFAGCDTLTAITFSGETTLALPEYAF
ncbi:MAG: leucine-rich repeat domain-containing protein, partial [Lachnospiraceae bacterium]|nr:leucine-rich repeat domain-containing protein [Lachnospiraceae bacterium]